MVQFGSGELHKAVVIMTNMEVKPGREKSENVTERERLGAGCDDGRR